MAGPLFGENVAFGIVAGCLFRWGGVRKMRIYNAKYHFSFPFGVLGK